MHFWATHAEAERYARSRPYFHDLVVERMLATLGIRGRVALALDIGSGSGQSATALAALADDVVAMDPSRPMLLSATDLNPQRIQAVGESLPIVDSCCDLMTVALSFHWLDRDRFLTEASRVLRTSGRLVIYNDFFLGRMRENPSFQTWHNGQYLKRYPVPARHDQPLTDADASRCGLGIIERQTYAHEVTFDVEELSSYLATQTNIIAAVQSGAVRAHDVRRWLIHSVADLFPRPKCCFAFGGIVWYLRPL